MAEGFANKHLKDFFISSAGIHPEQINQNAIKVMNEIGIDISNNKSDKINFNQLNSFDYIITLCGVAKDNCLNLSKYKEKHIHWDIEDPARFDSLSKEEINLKYFQVRDSIYNQILFFKKRLSKS